MIEELRRKYNSEFTEVKYQKFIADLNAQGNNNLDFRVSETPVFFTYQLNNELIKAGSEILNIIQSSDFKKHSGNSVPAKLIVPNEDDHTSFLQIDFAITKDISGKYMPRLIELQGFPTVYHYQYMLNKMIRKHFNIPAELTPFYNQIDPEKYLSLLKDIIVGACDPENVILLEIEPEKQKTRIDFYLAEKLTGISTVCITKISRLGNKLFYTKNGKEIPVHRIYNRVIFDELNARNNDYQFSFTDEIDVQWAGHPNWFFRISKYSLPFIKSQYSPECRFLSDYDSYPDDLDNYVLKPLYSFAGSGVEVNVTKQMLDSIPDRHNYILQKKVDYAPLIQTPDGYSKAEIRMMYIWKDEPLLINNLVRLSKGRMMGVSFNKDKTWVGSSIAYHAP